MKKTGANKNGPLQLPRKGEDNKQIPEAHMCLGNLFYRTYKTYKTHKTYKTYKTYGTYKT